MDREIYNVVCDRAYKGIYVDLRTTQIAHAQNENKDIIITCKDFPNQQMTIKLEEIESKKAYEVNKIFESKFANESSYRLKTYKFIAD